MPTIDCTELRRRVPIARVLELIAFRPVRRSGAELRGPCPIHRAASPRTAARSWRTSTTMCFTVSSAAWRATPWSCTPPCIGRTSTAQRLSGASDVTLKESTSKDSTSKDSTSVENIRFWEEDGSIRVVIDIAGNVTFKEGEARSPDRYFIDISPARLNSIRTIFWPGC